MTKPDGDLGFTFCRLKTGNVAISRHGCLATTLHGGKAVSFLLEMPRISHAEQQRKMAAITGLQPSGDTKGAPQSKVQTPVRKPD